MATQRIILVSILCFSAAALAAQSRSRVPNRPNWADRRLQKRKASSEHIRLMAREAWKNELRVSERQWRIIEPRHERVELVRLTMWAGAAFGLKDGKDFYWRKATEDRGGGWAPPKTAAELTEGERIVSELIDLVRQENPSDEELRQRIDALQQVREKARKELPKARRELAAALATPRQEAVFLLMGYID